MVRPSKRVSVTVLRLMAAALLLGCPRIGLAAGTWSIISLSQKAGDVLSPWALSIDGAGNLYVADRANGPRIQKRDAAGNWSVIATQGDALGQVLDFPNGAALAVDAVGSLYVADAGSDGNGRVQEYTPGGGP